MSDAQRLSDEGQQLAELEQSNAYVAYVQARKEFEAELYARLNAAPVKEQNDLRWILSTEWAEWMRSHPKPPEPPLRPYKPLALVGREPNRPGPMSDG